MHGAGVSVASSWRRSLKECRGEALPRPHWRSAGAMNLRLLCIGHSDSPRRVSVADTMPITTRMRSSCGCGFGMTECRNNTGRGTKEMDIKPLSAAQLRRETDPASLDFDDTSLVS